MRLLSTINPPRTRALLPLLALLLCAAPGTLLAQLENSIWYFGDHAGLDFRGGTVRAIPGLEYQWEGTSTLCDPRTGNLVMHTDGDTVWNGNGGVMPNGTKLGGHPSSTQSAIIVPYPEDPTRFYIITTDAGEYYFGGTTLSAHWSIVDMKLDGGRGAVTDKKVLLRGGVDEKVAVVKHCNGRGYWVVLHELRNSTFVVYYLSKNGFEGPRTFDLGTPHGGALESAIGGMKFNQAGDRLAVAAFGAQTVDVLDFDVKTGTLSNPIAIPVGEMVYDVCFSPDATKLYVTGEKTRYLKQYDVRGRTTAEIVATHAEIFRSTHRWASAEHVGGVQLGPDGRIYVSINEAEISVITRPNLAGAACDYRHRSIPLGARRFGIQGLPHFVYRLYDESGEVCRPPDARFRLSRAELCEGESLEITDETLDNPTEWRWDIPGGDPSSSTRQHPGVVNFANEGAYRIELIASNANGSDTFALDVRVRPRPQVDAGIDRVLCIGGDTQIGPQPAPRTTYAWTPATGLSCADCSNPIAMPLVTTTYRVTATNEYGCTSSDEITITVEPFPAVNAGRDTAICIGESVQLDGRGGAELLWSPTTGLSCTTCPDPIATPLVSTTYTLITSNNGRCPSIDSVRITVNERPVAEAGPDRFICRGESAELGASGGARYVWSPAATLSCVECAEPTAYPEVTTTYHVQVFNAAGCPSTDSLTIHVDPAPRLVHADLGPDVGIYPGTELELPVVLQEPLDSAFVSVVDIGIDYDPTIMHLKRATLDSSLTEGWTVIVTSEDRARGRFTARLFAANGETLNGIGIVARLRFQTFINFGDSSTARLTMSLPGEECTRIETKPTIVRLDSICGLAQRLIAMSGESYALRQNSPNPFNPATTIAFSLGLDARTRVEVLDVTGRSVAVLADGMMTAGEHTLEWDGSAQPSGMYYCRITSGEWTRTIVMALAK